ncbi:MAG: hypothetical protein ACFCAD_28675 [Pleurocapsa sp.]
MDKHQSPNNYTEIELEPTMYSVASNQGLATEYDGLMGVLFMGIVTVAGFNLMYRRSPFYLDRVRPLKPNIFKRFAQPTCKKCRFYNRNGYFKCSVHSLRGNNLDAENCPNYWQRDRRKFMHR